MLQILLGTDQRGLSAALLGRVCRDAAQGVTGQILIVPEQYSHETERSLCAAGGDGISLSAEVLSFSRLASRVCALYGGVSRKTLDKGGRLIAMSLALESVASRLKLYGVSRKKPEFLLRMLAMLEECKGARIDAAQLRRAAALTGGQLAVKLEELALILESFDTVCATLGQDAQDRLTRLRSLLETHDYAAGRSVYLLGFSDFTGQELAVIEALLADADVVCVGLLGDGGDVGPFASGAETARQLQKLAFACGSPCTTERLPEAGAAVPALLHLRRRLFFGAASPWEEETDAVALHRSSSVYGACMDAAGRIQALVQEQGFRYREIAVCCAQPEVYEPVLASVFGRFGIPLYASGADPIESDPVVGMVLAALEAATGGLEPEDVLRFLKSGLSPVDQADCDELENYVRTWRIRGRKWETAWDMHPDGYGFALDDTARETLRRVNESRVRGAGPLLALRDGLRAAADTAAQVLALYDFLERIGLARTLHALQARCATGSELQQAQAYGQMYEILIDAMEQLHRVLGRTVREPSDFSDLFAAVLSQYTVGTIPANLDSVTVGDPAAMRFGSCRALLLLGADDGAFPACRTEAGLFSEQERRKLLALGLGLSPGQSLQLDRELTGIYQVLTSASERLLLGFCGEQPSYLFARAQELFPLVRRTEDAVLPEILFFSAASLGELLAGHGEPALSDLAEAGPPELRLRAEALAKQAAYRPGALDGGAVRALYGQKLYLSASRIDQYAACRCAYFLRYGLKLRPQKEAAFDAPIYGTFVHAVLEETARQVREEGGFHAVTETRLEEIAREKMASYRDDTLEVMLARSERLAYLYRRNLDEVLEVVRDLGRELRRSDFEPAGFEVEFSLTGQMPPVEVEGKTVRAELSGFVDRVDLYTHNGVTYARVVDYKTGRKAFDYTDVLNGMGLQMLIYLFALEDHGERVFGQKLRPAGVLYFPARRALLPASGKLPPEEAIKKRQAEQGRKGLISAEEPVLRAMETCDGAPLYMPYQISAKGELTGDLADASDMRLLRDHVRRTLSRMADDMAGGTVDPNPIVRGTETTACAYCDYAQVCHRASGEVCARPMRKTDRKEFWALLEEEQHG